MYWLVVLLLGTIAYLFWKKERHSGEGKYVLITGCDTGFGQMATNYLSNKGIHVFAGCLTKNGVEQYNSSYITPFLMDVTNDESVNEAIELIRGKLGTEGLWGVVNNAGICTAQFLDFLPIPYLDRMLQINFIGVARVTKAALPLLKRNKGSRIINIGSVAGYITVPSFSGYCASKFAVRGFSNSIRQELKPWNIYVSCIEPAFMNTPLIQSISTTSLRLFDQAPTTLKDQYGDFSKWTGESNSLVDKIMEDPQLVVNAIEAALLEKSPSTNYLPGYFAKIFRAISKLPEPVIDWFGRALPSPNRHHVQ